MTKEQLVKEIAKKNDLTLVKSQAILEDAISIIEKQLKKEGRFSLKGFGAFTVKTIKKRKVKGIDGAEHTVPKHKRVYFRAFKGLNEKINGKK